MLWSVSPKSRFAAHGPSSFPSFRKNEQKDAYKAYIENQEDYIKKGFIREIELGENTRFCVFHHFPSLGRVYTFLLLFVAVTFVLVFVST